MKRLISSCLAVAAQFLLLCQVSLAAPLTSLDLTNTSTVSTIKTMQNNGQLGGSLKVSGGVAVGGTLILYHNNLASSITAADIPANVTVTMIGFSAHNPLTVALTNASTKANVQIDGHVDIMGVTPVVNISNTNAGASSFVMTGTGSLTSISGLTINSAGNVALGGEIKSTNLTFNTTSNGLGNGSMVLSGNVGTGFSSLAFHLNGGGNLTQTSGVLQGGRVTLTSDGGNIGVLGNAITTTASRFTLGTSGGGTVFLTDNRSATIDTAHTGGTFRLDDTGSVVADHVTSDAGSVSLFSGDMLTVEHTIDAGGGDVKLESSNIRSGQILIDPGSTISANANSPTTGNVTIAITNGSVPQTNTTAPNNIHKSTSGGGQVFFGTNSIFGLPPTSEVTANGGTITFSTGDLPNHTIFIGGGTHITATKVDFVSPEQGPADEVVVDTGDDGSDYLEKTALVSN